MEIQGVLDFGDLSNIKYISPYKEFDLTDITLYIRLFYNLVDEHLYMDIYDETETVLAYGIKLIPNVGLLKNIQYKLGVDTDIDIVVFSTTEANKYSEVTADNIGEEMNIYYVKDV